MIRTTSPVAFKSLVVSPVCAILSGCGIVFCCFWCSILAKEFKEEKFQGLPVGPSYHKFLALQVRETRGESDQENSHRISLWTHWTHCEQILSQNFIGSFPNQKINLLFWDLWYPCQSRSSIQLSFENLGTSLSPKHSYIGNWPPVSLWG